MIKYVTSFVCSVCGETWLHSFSMDLTNAQHMTVMNEIDRLLIAVKDHEDDHLKDQMTKMGFESSGGSLDI